MITNIPRRIQEMMCHVWNIPPLPPLFFRRFLSCGCLSPHREQSEYTRQLEALKKPKQWDLVPVSKCAMSHPLCRSEDILSDPPLPSPAVAAAQHSSFGCFISSLALHTSPGKYLGPSLSRVLLWIAENPPSVTTAQVAAQCGPWASSSQSALQRT